MDLHLSDDQLRSAITAAIVQALGPEKREQLLSTAVATLLAAPVGQGGYGSDKRSHVQRAFDECVVRQAEVWLREMIANDGTLRAKVEGLFEEAVAKTFDDEEARAELVGKIAGAIRKSFDGSRY